MQRIENYDAIQATSGEFMKPQAGGYVCKIVDAEDVPLDAATGKGDYIRINYDISEGQFAGFYKDQFDKWGGSWSATFVRSYKEKARGMFKHFTNCVEASNANYKWDFDELSLIGKDVGLVLGEEEYRNAAGEAKTKLVVKFVKTVDEIRNGDFKVPEIQKLAEEPKMEFKPIDDDSIPF